MDVRRITDENTYMENFRHLRCGYEERLIFDLIDWLRRNHFKINWDHIYFTIMISVDQHITPHKTLAIWIFIDSMNIDIKRLI